MTRKAEFNAEEWSTVVEGPVYAGMRVISAERGGTLRESLAVGRVYREAREQQGESQLLDELVASAPAIDKTRVQGSGPEALVQLTRERLQEAMRILDEKGTPEEIDAYKKFVMTVAQAAAEAHKEGGFLGVGGTRVSEKENQALDEISVTLGAPPAS